MDAQVLLNVISQLGEEQKIQLVKMLGIEKTNNVSEKEKTEKEDTNSLQQLEQKYQLQPSSLNVNQCATSAEVAQVKNKVETVQLELIDIVRHLKEYTKKYMDMSREQQSEAMLEYINQSMGQNKQLSTLQQMKNEAEGRELKETQDVKERENKGGIVGNMARGAINVVTTAFKGANSMLNSAGEGLTNVVGNITNKNEETPAGTPEETSVGTPEETPVGIPVNVENTENINTTTTTNVDTQPSEQMLNTLTNAVEELNKKVNLSNEQLSQLSNTPETNVSGETIKTNESTEVINKPVEVTNESAATIDKSKQENQIGGTNRKSIKYKRRKNKRKSRKSKKTKKRLNKKRLNKKRLNKNRLNKNRLN